MVKAVKDTKAGFVKSDSNISPDATLQAARERSERKDPLTTQSTQKAPQPTFPQIPAPFL